MSHSKPEKKFLLVINQGAGRKKKAPMLKSIEQFFSQDGLVLQSYETSGDQIKDKEEIKNQIDTFHPDTVIAMGGDGTINVVGELLIGSKIPLGIIPAGSSNGLAKDLNIPASIDDALEIIKKLKSKPLDTLLINGKHCFHISDIGFNAKVVHRFALSLLRGKGSYVWHALKEFLGFTNFKYHIETPLLKYDGRAFMITISNTNKFGTNASINPLGDPEDGYFEINIIKPFPKIMLPYILFRLFNHTIHLSSYHKIIRCKKAVIYNVDSESFHIDGEPQEIPQTIYVDIFPKGLKILLPEK